MSLPVHLRGFSLHEPHSRTETNGRATDWNISGHPGRGNRKPKMASYLHLNAQPEVNKHYIWKLTTPWTELAA